MYCTQQDLIDRFGEQELIQLTDRSNTGGINTQVLDQAIDDANGEIDGYLAGRYSLPLATVPPVLARIACDIARYHLYDDAALEQVRTRYEDARRLLESISKGGVRLGLPSNEGPVEEVGLPEFEGGRNEFNGGGF